MSLSRPKRQAHPAQQQSQVDTVVSQLTSRTKRHRSAPTTTVSAASMPSTVEGTERSASSSTTTALPVTLDQVNELFDSKCDQIIARMAVTKLSSPATILPDIPAPTVTLASFTGDYKGTEGSGIDHTLKLLSPSLRQNVLLGDYIELDTLLPANLSGQIGELDICLSLTSTGLAQLKRPITTKIASIESWLDAFTIYSLLLVENCPARFSDLMRYEAYVRKLASEFEGVAWVRYDRLFRQKMASNKSLSWATPDTQLFTDCFTGMARTGCRLCSAPDHRVDQCGFRHISATSADPQLFRGNRPNGRKYRPGSCYTFNREGKCRSADCKFQHICGFCGHDHSAKYCPTGPTDD